jgi:hypothetical protein
MFPPKQLAKLKSDFQAAMKDGKGNQTPSPQSSRPEKTMVTEPPSNVHVMHVHQDGTQQLPTQDPQDAA